MTVPAGRPLDVDVVTVLVTVVGVAVALTLVVAASTSTAAFGAYNTGWDGASDLGAHVESAGAEPTLVRNTTAYTRGNPRETVAIVIAPHTGYGPRDRERLRAFVRDGGTVVVAEDYGPHANELVAALNATARFDGRPVRDERYHGESPAFVRARNVSGASLVRDVDALTLNHGTVLQPGNATVVVRTSGYAYLDADRDGDLDASDPMQAWPVIATERVGAGRLVLVSDASVLINAMLDASGNAAFVTRLVTGHDRVLLDYSHAGGLPPLAALVLALRDAPLAQFGAGVLGVGALAGWAAAPRLRERLAAARGGPAGKSLSPSRDQLVAYLEREHPTWDRDRLDRVVDAVVRDESE